MPMSDVSRSIAPLGSDERTVGSGRIDVIALFDVRGHCIKIDLLTFRGQLLDPTPCSNDRIGVKKEPDCRIGEHDRALITPFRHQSGVFTRDLPLLLDQHGPHGLLPGDFDTIELTSIDRIRSETSRPSR